MDYASSNNPVLKYYAKTQGSTAARNQNMEDFASSNNPVLQHYAKVNTPKPAVTAKSATTTTPITTPDTTRATGAGVGGSAPEIQLPQIRAFGAGNYPAPNLGRVGNVLAAAGTGAAAGFVEAAGQVTQPQGLTIGESARVGLQGGTRAQEQAAEQAKAQRIRETIKNPLYATADKLQQQSEVQTQKAKEDLGKVGQFAVDLGVTGAQLLGDVALGAINPVLGTASMATRVFGSSAQEARQVGATETQQQLYGLGSAAVSVLVEKIANVGKAFKTAYGGSIAGGSVDDILTKIIGKAVKNPTGQRVLASAAGEAGEEALEAILQPALQAIYDQGETLNHTWFGSTEELTDYLADVGYNALLGGVLGALGGGGNVTTPATTETTQGGAESAPVGAETRRAGSEAPAPQTGAQRPQNAPVRLEDTAAEGILLGGATQRRGFTSMENAIANQFERETGIRIEEVESILGGLANGDYNSANWVARIAQDAKDPKMVVVAHELTHHLQTMAPQEYEAFRGAVADYFTRAGGEAVLTDMMNRYRSAYGEAGQNLSDSAVMDEMAADFTQVLLEDAGLFDRFARENRTLAERLLDALRALIAKIRATFTGSARDAAAQEATGKTLSELEEIAEQWQATYNAAAAAYGQNAKTATQEGDGVRYSFAGINARSANLQQLQTAQEMEARGVDNETIRKETGWFRGMDGKWRFEIDDSGMVYRREGDALFRKNHPEYVEHQTLTEKFLFGTITAEEQQRLLELEEIWGREHGRLSDRVKSGNAKLRDVLQHDALFEAYPQLGDIGVVFEDLPSGENASFNRRTNTIKISNRLANAVENTLLHEIQHAIQKEEGFAKGANPAYWERRINEGYDRRWAGVPWQQMMPSELYRNTAGEIEARDVAERQNLTQQERKLRMPNLGDENTVFADGSAAEYEIKYPVFSEEDIKNNSIKLQTMGSVETLTGNELGDSNVLLSTRVRKYFEALGNNVHTEQFGDVALPSSSVRSEIRHGNTPTKVMTYAAIPAVLQNGVVIYQNTKNAQGLERIVVAAPIEVGTPAEHMYVGVMLQRDPQNQRLYLHDVVTEKELSIGSGEHLNPTGPNTSNGELYTTDILRNALTVKGNLQQLKSTAPLRQAMREIQMPRLTTVEQDAAEAAVKEATAVDKAGDEAAAAAVPEAKAALDELAALTAGDEKSQTKGAVLPAGTKVRAADRGNIGTVVSYNKQDKTYVVNFVSPEGNAAEVTLPEDMVKSKEDEDFEAALSLLNTKTTPQEKTFKENVAESWSFLKRKMVDSGEAVTRIGKAIGDKYLYPYFNMARASTSAGVNMIAGEQTDVMGNRVGESLNDIFDPILAKGDDYYEQFQMYLLDLHNVDRMSITERSEPFRKEAREAFDSYAEAHPEFTKMTKEEIERQAKGEDEAQAEAAKEYLRLGNRVNRANGMHNKAIFSWKATAEESRARAERLLREHPEFAQYREQIRKYIDNLMQYRVDSGLITQQDADFLHNYYPDYVPVYRVEVEGEEINKESGKKKRVGKTIGTAKGGEEQIMPIHEALGKQTMQVVREGSKNRFGARLLSDYLNNAENEKLSQYILEVKSTEHDVDLDSWDSIEEKELKGNVFSLYRDGHLHEMAVNDELFEAAKALSPDTREAVKLTGLVVKANRLYKALITGYNPFFTIRNIVRDLQAAGLYSREFGAWGKNYPKALKEIFANGEAWKQYRALGGDMSSMFEYETSEGEQLNWKYKKDTEKGKAANAAKNVMSKVEFVNVAMEQAPRLAEFMAVMEKGDGSLDAAMDAMLAAADVTTNFGRSGTLAKYFNQYYIPFLNPSIQGFDKLLRFFRETNTGKKWGRLILYASALGIAPRLLGELLYGDDDEWKEMRDSVRNANYVFKVGDTWIKIPRGREIAVPYTLLDAGIDQARGEDVRWLPTIKEALSQVTPVNPFKESIVRPLIVDLPLNKTWYGGDIETQRMQNYAPGKRYDTSTDVVSKAIGGALNVSPAKLSYLADQFTGVVGDIALPLLTPEAEGNFIAAQFTVDPVMSNELSGKFYDKADELKYAKNDGDNVAAVVSRYWNRVSSEVSEVYAKIRKIEENKDLKPKEKLKQVRELQQQVNALQREALATVDQYTAAVESSLFGDDDDAADFASREANREVFGAEYALKAYNKDVYAKAKEAVKSGVSYEDYYDYYFATKDIEGDKDASGKPISGSKREKVLAEINAMDLTVAQKNALYYASGYVESTLYEAPWYNIRMPRL